MEELILNQQAGTQGNKRKFNKLYAMQLATIFLGFIVFGISENIKGPAIPRIQFDFNLDEKQARDVIVPKCTGLPNRVLLHGYSGSQMGHQGG